MSEKLQITFGKQEISSDDISFLIKGISSLQGFNPIMEEPPLTSVKKKMGKKKEKKNDKKKKNDELFGTLTFSELDDKKSKSDEEDIVEDFVELEEMYIRDLERGMDESIIDEQKNNYNKLKTQENPYKKEFAEELTILYNLLDEANKFGKKIEKDFDVMSGSKTRGMSKYSNDLIASILTSKSTKLAIVKEIASVKKTIADLKIKADDKAAKLNGGKNGETKGADYIAASYFKNIMEHGRKNFIQELTGKNGVADENDVPSSLLESIDGLNGFEAENYDKLLEDRLSEVDNEFRTEDGSKYIQYENLGVKIFVKRCIDNGEWEFTALDKFNQEVPDYPVPRKDFVGKLTFNSDGSYATDNKGRSYKVIEYFLPDEE